MEEMIKRIHDDAVAILDTRLDGGYVPCESGDVLQYVLWDLERLGNGRVADRTAKALCAVKEGLYGQAVAERVMHD